MSFDPIITIGWVDEERTEIGFEFSDPQMSIYDAAAMLCETVGYIAAYADNLAEKQRGIAPNLGEFLPEAQSKIVRGYNVEMKRDRP